MFNFSLKRFFYLILIVSAFSTASMYSQGQLQFAKEKTSAFSKIDFEGNNVFVGYKSRKYKWVKMDSISISKLVDLFKKNFGRNWQKRFSTDFVEYANKLEIYPKQLEVFTLVDEEGHSHNLKMEFTAHKRAQAYEYYKSIYNKRFDAELKLSKTQAIEDINQLEKLILEKYSYFFLNQIPIFDEIRLLKNEVEGGVSAYDFALRIGMFLNKFGDGHTRISKVDFNKKGVLPFQVKPFDGKVVCLKEGKLLNPKYPYLHSINQVKVSRLLQISESYFTSQASPQYINRVKVKKLHSIGEILSLAGSTSEVLYVMLMSKKGKTTAIQMPIIEQKQRQNSPQLVVKHFDKVGYLKINSMLTLRKINSLISSIKKLKNKKSLIIDVRGNGGGSREILMELAPHFISAKQNFVIGNIARYRFNNMSADKNLSDRFLYNIEDDFFTEKDKQNIKSWSKKFKPNISLQDSLYSSAYYLYIKRHKEPYFSNTPTVVLMDEGCFSATDIFLSTFKEIEGVTLIGTPSGGGSGRSVRYKLKNSLIEIKLSTIVSFQPNGSLYDGIGVQPDRVIHQNGLSDIIGKTDFQLEFALKYLK